MTTCGLSRVLVVGLLVGMATAALTGSDGFGLLAGLVAAVSVVVVGRVGARDSGGGSCAVDAGARARGGRAGTPDG